MQHSVIVTGKTLLALDLRIAEWAEKGFKLHGEIVVTLWEDTRMPDGSPGMHSKAVDFARTMVRTEGTCRQDTEKGKDE